MPALFTGEYAVRLPLLAGYLAGAAAWKTAHDAKDALVSNVIALGGTCSGEHGVGLGNRRYMQQEHGGSLAVMARIKDAFDPDGILNPGKIFPQS